MASWDEEMPVPILCGKEAADWRAKMKVYLKAHDALRFVKEDVKPIDLQGEDRCKFWRTYSVLVQSVAPNHHNIVSEAPNTPFGLWNEISDHFQQARTPQLESQPSVEAPPLVSLAVSDGITPPTPRQITGGKSFVPVSSQVVERAEENFDSFIWKPILEEARTAQESSCPIIQRTMHLYFHKTILKHKNFESVLANLISVKFCSKHLPNPCLRELIFHALERDPTIIEGAKADLTAHVLKDPACTQKHVPLLYAKGFLAVETYRVAHWFWVNDEKSIAHFLHSRMCEVLGMDIHPGAVMGKGIFIDHGTGVVIGETCIIEDNVSIFHEVTLGATGKHSGPRHPIVREGALIGAGAKILGRIEIGAKAKIAASAVVLDNVPSHITVAGQKAELKNPSNLAIEFCI